MSGCSPTNRFAAGLALAAATMLTGCQPQPAATEEAEITPAARLEAVDRHLAAGETLYHVDRDSSRAVILVRRAGPLARFGHDHAIVARPAGGFVIWSEEQPASGRASLEFDVLSLEVDPPAARRAFRLDTEPDAEAIAATRSNMLKHVLRAEQWPVIELTLHHVSGTYPAITARLELLINGRRGAQEIPVHLEMSPGRLNASGRLELRQSDWGLEPFAVLGGGLRVDDTIEIHFELGAVAESDPAKTKAPR